MTKTLGNRTGRLLRLAEFACGVGEYKVSVVSREMTPTDDGQDESTFHESQHRGKEGSEWGKGQILGQPAGSLNRPWAVGLAIG